MVPLVTQLAGAKLAEYGLPNVMMGVMQIQMVAGQDPLVQGELRRDTFPPPHGSQTTRPPTAAGNHTPIHHPTQPPNHAPSFAHPTFSPNSRPHPARGCAAPYGVHHGQHRRRCTRCVRREAARREGMRTAADSPSRGRVDAGMEAAPRGGRPPPPVSSWRRSCRPDLRAVGRATGAVHSSGHDGQGGATRPRLAPLIRHLGSAGSFTRQHPRLCTRDELVTRTRKAAWGLPGRDSLSHAEPPACGRPRAWPPSSRPVASALPRPPPPLFPTPP